jgi:uncharacterized membrane protein YhaH (DUF805 family)
MDSKRQLLFAAVGLGVSIAAKIAFGFIPQGRFWGINQLAYYPYPAAIVLNGLFIALVILCLNHKVVEKINRFYIKWAANARRVPAIPRAVILVGLSFAIFYVFRDFTNLLGDGLLRIGELQNKRLENFLNQHSAEPLDYLIHYFVYSNFLEPLKIKPIMCYQFISALAGIIYIYAARSLSKKIGGGKYKGFAFWYFFGWGGIMLFFGYVESYALAAAVLMVLFSCGHDIIHKRGNAWGFALLFLLAFFLHNSLIVLLPAVAYLIYKRSDRINLRAITALSLLTLIVGGWTWISLTHRQSPGLLISGNLSEPGYTVFSSAHFGDIVNELFLISPAFLTLIFLNIRGGENRANHLRIYYGLAVLGGLGFLFLADPVLGMGRDWDLFALPLLGFHVGLFAGVNWERIDIRIKAAILVLMLFSTLTWIGVNRSESASVERYKNIAGLDAARSRYAFERLGTYLLLYRNWQKAEEVYKLSLQKEPHYRTYLGLAYAQAQSGKSDSAEFNYEKALELNPDQALALFSLCQAYIRDKKIVRARELFERLKRIPTTGIVNISERGIRELEENLIRAEQELVDTIGTK